MWRKKQIQKQTFCPFLLNYCRSEWGYLDSYLSWNKQLINTKLLKCFADHMIIQNPNMTQVTIAIKFSRRENDISSRKRKKDQGKKAFLEKVKIAAKN